MPHIAKLEFNGNPNLGLYCVATDKFVLLGQTIKKTIQKQLAEIFQVPVISCSIYGTDMIGVFSAATSNTVIVPNVIFPNELEHLKKMLKGIAEVKTIRTGKTALGNNILNNDSVAFISRDYSKSNAEQISKALGVKVIQIDMAGSQVPGSAGVLTNRGAIFSSNLKGAEIFQIEKALGFEIGLGSVNMGNTMLGGGVVSNSQGIIAGGLSSGYEIARIDESIGFLN